MCSPSYSADSAFSFLGRCVYIIGSCAAPFVHNIADQPPPRESRTPFLASLCSLGGQKRQICFSTQSGRQTRLENKFNERFKRKAAPSSGASADISERMDFSAKAGSAPQLVFLSSRVECLVGSFFFSPAGSPLRFFNCHEMT